MDKNRNRTFGFDLINTNLFFNLDNSKNENLQKPQSKRKSFLFQEFNQKKITSFISLKNKNNESTSYIEALLKEYGIDIFNEMKSNEKINICNYTTAEKLFELQNKKYFNEKIRCFIFHWLLVNNQKWKLKEESVYLAMNIMDRYVSKVKITNNEYQLIAITSYFIATKYEDIYPPNLNTLLRLCKNGYSNDEVLETEYKILKELKFDILYNSSYKFLKFLFTVSNYQDLKIFYLAQFLLELGIESIEFLSHSPCSRAVSALLVAKKLMSIKGNYNSIKFFYDYDEVEINNIQKKFVGILKKIYESKDKKEKGIIFEKFNKKQYMFVASLVIEICDSNRKKKLKNTEEKEESKIKITEEKTKIKEVKVNKIKKVNSINANKENEYLL